MNTPILPSERLMLTPREFAAVLGRHSSWAYRQIYAGKIEVLLKFGQKMIRRSELDRFSSCQKG